MNLYLKVNDDWLEPDVDTSTDVSFALNYTFDTLESPTDYMSTFSYDFQLPKTEKNNKLFGLFNEIPSSEQFPPNELIEFLYYGGGNTVSRGECYITEINEEHYTLAMNGSLQTVFSKLLNSGWNKIKAEEDNEYYLLPELWKNITFSPTTLKSNWEFDTNSAPFSWTSVKDYPFQLQRFNYIAGFAPTQPNDNSYVSNKLVDVNGNETDIQEETNAHQMSEWKVNDTSLYPYVYVLRLWQIFQEHCKTITDYDLLLDDRWYNTDYEFLRNLVYVLPSISQSDENDVENDGYPVRYTLDEFANDKIEMESSVHSGDVVKFGYVIPMRFDLNKPQTGCVWNFNMSYGFVVDFKVVDSLSNVKYNKKKCFVFYPDKKRNNGNYQYNMSVSVQTQLLNIVDEVEIVRYSAGSNVTFYKDADGVMRNIYQFPSVSDEVTLSKCVDYHTETEMYWINWMSSSTSVNNRLFRPYIPKLDAWQYPDIQPEGFYTTTMAATTTIINNTVDNQKLTMEKLFKDVSPFSVLLKYAKMLSFVFVVDDNKKTINVMRRSDFIWDCFHEDMSGNDNAVNPYTGYYDITDITDFKTWSIKPLAWATRNVVIGYDESDDDYAKKYKETYGNEYGSLKIITKNRINNETDNLLNTNDYNTISPTILTTENVMPYNHLISANPDYILDSDEFLRPISNCFAFRLANGTWNEDIRDGWRVDKNGCYVLISTAFVNDAIVEEDGWHTDGYTNDMKCYSRPVFSDVNENKCLLFAIPHEVYNGRDYNSYQYLFELEWYNYVEEVYNINNKTIKVKCYLESDDYDRMSRCPFVVLGGLGYFVTSISGWSEYNKLCKVVLRQIENLTYLEQPSKSYTEQPQPINIENVVVNVPSSQQTKRLSPILE